MRTSIQSPLTSERWSDTEGLAELHRVAKALAQRVVGELREQLPEGAAEQLGQRPLEQAHGHAVGVYVAVLPVQGDECLVDLVEQGAGARFALLERARRASRIAPVAELAQTAVEHGRRRAHRRLARHAHLEPAVDAQLERVHEGGDDEQAAAVVHAGVGDPLRPKALQVEAPALVFDQRDQRVAVELEGDVDVGVGAAVADGVGGGLFDAQYEVVDQVALGAVLAQIVANALAGAPQVRRLGGNAKAQTGRGCVCLELVTRQLTPRTCVARVDERPIVGTRVGSAPLRGRSRAGRAAGDGGRSRARAAGAQTVSASRGGVPWRARRDSNPRPSVP